ncbi:hypothetical protein ABZ297_24850 [Nonomuraea sp. NPDC005983]
MILPFTILRRLDCILEPDRETVRDLAAAWRLPKIACAQVMTM